MKLSPEAFLELLEDLSLIPNVKLDLPGEIIKWESHSLKLPLLRPASTKHVPKIEDLIKHFQTWDARYLIVLVRSGSASMGYWEAGTLQVHKVIRKYMVRKKQGKSQLSHLKTKGKSRLGSRIRLRESLEFFEEINEKLDAWIDEFGMPELIFYSCPISLKAHWHSSKIPIPFDLKADYIKSLPFHVHQPTYEELLRIQKLISQAELVVNEDDPN